MDSQSRLKPVLWSVLIFVLSELLTFIIVSHMEAFLQTNDIYIPPQEVPESALGPVLIYFFGVVIFLGAVLYLVPAFILTWILRILFALLFSWGMFIVLVFWLPEEFAIGAALLIGIVWVLRPAIWLHNSVMILTMVSVGSVFGRVFSPWTAMIVMLVLSLYDFLAVRFGYMLWMARKLSRSNALPAFIIPRKGSEWGLDLKQTGVGEVVEEEPSQREFSILGGGDIGFPLLLISSVFFAYGAQGFVIVAIFALLGLILAYWIQAAFLKGRPLPALPPITAVSLVGFLLVYFTHLA